MARGTACVVHVHDTTIPQERHHVWPLGYHGPDKDYNKILICCNAHSDIHYFMEYLFKHNGENPPDWRTYSPNVRMWAREGYRDVIEYGKQLSESMK